MRWSASAPAPSPAPAPSWRRRAARPGRAFWASAFPDHPAGRPANGTAESLAAIPPEALRATLDAQLRRDGLLIGVRRRDPPGPARHAAARTCSAPCPPARRQPRRRCRAFTAFGRQVVTVPSPQSQIVFGQPGITPQDPDWETAQVVLRVLGGGGFSSRLMEAVRVQRGLTYGIGVGLDTLFGGGVITGAFATENAKVAEALEVTRGVWADLAQHRPDRGRAGGSRRLPDRLPAAAIHRQPAHRRDAAGDAPQRPADRLAGRAQRPSAGDHPGRCGARSPGSLLKPDVAGGDGGGGTCRAVAAGAGRRRRRCGPRRA